MLDPRRLRRLAPLATVVVAIAALVAANALVGLLDDDAAPASRAGATAAVGADDPQPSPADSAGSGGSAGRATPPPTPGTTTTTVPSPPDDGRTSAERELVEVETITGDLAPKSVVGSGTGLFFAQNMMYRHTVAVYDRGFSLVATIPDTVDLAAFGHDVPSASYQGAPVEVAFTSDGDKAYVSNYQMYGPGYDRPGDDDCEPGDWDESYVYRIDTDSLEIDQVIGVGAVPKFVAVTPDDRYVLVTNWCGYDLSVVDVATGREVRRIPIGRHPRGIAVTGDSRTAYVAVMGAEQAAVVDLRDFSVDWLYTGPNPRHVVLSPDDDVLYATLNRAGRVAKIDLTSGETVAAVETGAAPRSMDVAADGEALYVVNYRSDTVAKVRTSDMTVTQTVPVAHLPIGVTYDATTRNVWVSSYSGVLTVLGDR